MNERIFENRVKEAKKVTNNVWRPDHRGLQTNGFHIEKVSKTRTGIVARATPLAGKNIAHNVYRDLDLRRSKILLFYPEERHAENFAHSVKTVEKNGPTELFPGTVGSAHVRVHEDIIHVTDVQGHFKQEKTHAISRGLATRYGGWRMGLLKAALELAKQVGVNKVSCQPHNNGTREDFLKAAKKAGFNKITEQKITVFKKLFSTLIASRE